MWPKIVICTLFPKSKKVPLKRTIPPFAKSPLLPTLVQFCHAVTWGRQPRFFSMRPPEMHSTPIGPQTTNHIFALVCATPRSVYYNITKRSKTAHDDSVANWNIFIKLKSRITLQSSQNQTNQPWTFWRHDFRVLTKNQILASKILSKFKLPLYWTWPKSEFGQFCIKNNFKKA